MGGDGTVVGLLTVAATLAGCLLAGVYLAFALAVVPALSRLPDRAFVLAWQVINRVILRPGFLLVFLGAPVLAVALALVRGLDGGSGWPLAALVAGALGQVGGLVSTGVAHVPLNTALDRGEASTPAAAAATRAAFERPWAARHRARTALTVLASALVTAGAVAG